MSPQMPLRYGFLRFTSFQGGSTSSTVMETSTEPQSLLSWVLKAKYFPTKDLMQVSAKPGILYAWHSLLVSLHFLQQGVRQRVQNGLSIHEWQDPSQIMKPYSFKPLPYNQYLAENLRVADLISHDLCVRTPKYYSISFSLRMLVLSKISPYVNRLAPILLSGILPNPVGLLQP